MKKRRFLAMVMAAVVVAVCAAGCGSSENETADTAVESQEAEPRDEADAGENGGEVIIGMCNANLAEPWNAQMDTDVANAAKAYPNVTVQYKDAAGDSLTQRSQVEEFINAGVDALLISPVESTPMTEIITEAYDAGIPVFLIGRLIDNDSYTQYIGTDDFSLGYVAGQYVVDYFGDEEAKVVQLDGLMTSSPGYDRHLGFIRALEGHDNIEIIHTADCKWVEDSGRSEMESVLSVYDKVDAVFGGNDPTAHGAYMAAVNADRADEMIFFGIDGLAAEGQAYVRDGVFQMTIYDATGGDVALNNAMKYLSGEEVGRVYLKEAVVFEKDTLESGGTVVTIPDDVDRSGQQTPILE